MKSKIKLLLTFAISLLVLSPLHLQAEEEETLVCFYRTNCKGEEEYVCVNSKEIEPH